MNDILVKKIIFFISTILVSNILYAKNLQYFVNQASYQTLSAPYQYYNYQPPKMMDKAIKELPSFANVKKCSTNYISDAIVIVKPVLNYQAQSTILYGDLHVKIYQTRSESETNPDNFIKDMKITHWDVLKFDTVTMDFYINKIYKTLLE